MRIICFPQTIIIHKLQTISFDPEKWKSAHDFNQFNNNFLPKRAIRRASLNIFVVHFLDASQLCQQCIQFNRYGLLPTSFERYFMLCHFHATAVYARNVVYESDDSMALWDVNEIAEEDWICSEMLSSIRAWCENRWVILLFCDCRWYFEIR